MVVVMPDTVAQSPEGFALIQGFGAKYNIPVIGSDLSERNEALLTCAPDVADVGKQSALTVQEIFNGVSAGSIPIVTPATYLTLNESVARTLGVTLSPDVIAKANQVIP
jgi:putative ABC transport system substrate-binding protein